VSPYGTQQVPISTRGGPSCQVQNTVTRSAPEENSTRIHDSVFHTCIDQPGPGVAETREAEVVPGAVPGDPGRRPGRARELGEGKLGARVPEEGSTEPRLAAVAFNSMADQVVWLLANERGLAADLSHRLRTPL
jgi:signal transduction histidine kinase